MTTKEYYQKNKEKILVKRKKHYQDNREYILSRQKEYFLKNRTIITKKAKIYAVQYRKDNKEVIRIKQKYYYSTERGFMNNLWNSIKRSSRKKNLINKFKDFDEFYNHWLEQKKIHGMKCPATGVEMTTIKGVNKPGEYRTVMTNISTDRILSTEGYSPENLIFTTWEYNKRNQRNLIKIIKKRV